MTVKELIEILAKLDPETIVVCGDSEGDYHHAEVVASVREGVIIVGPGADYLA